jgi:GWxTD domain-containing protein
VDEPPLNGRRKLRGAAALAVAVALALVLAGCSSSGVVERPGELINTYLGPDYAQWLAGPIARMATPEEIRQYLALTDDFAAVDFIEAFWSRRDPAPAEPGNPVRDAFERRVAEADRQFGEAGIPGRRTDRGTIYVLYGKPADVSFDVAAGTGEAVEVWSYGADAGPGLDGKRPERFYWFREESGVKRFYHPGGRRAREPIH